MNRAKRYPYNRTMSVEVSFTDRERFETTYRTNARTLKAAHTAALKAAHRRFLVDRKVTEVEVHPDLRYPVYYRPVYARSRWGDRG